MQTTRSSLVGEQLLHQPQFEQVVTPRVFTCSHLEDGNAPKIQCPRVKGSPILGWEGGLVASHHDAATCCRLPKMRILKRGGQFLDSTSGGSINGRFNGFIFTREFEFIPNSRSEIVHDLGVDEIGSSSRPRKIECEWISLPTQGTLTFRNIYQSMDSGFKRTSPEDIKVLRGSGSKSPTQTTSAGNWNIPHLLSKTSSALTESV
ncbi:hypothetical protein Tco_0559594 [Tanacetum coccineum]